MKTLLRTITLCLLIGVGTLNAQTKRSKVTRPTTPIPSRPITLPPGTLNGNLNLEKIKQDLKSGKLCYMTTLSTNTIFPPKNPKAVKDIVGYFISSGIRHERNYLGVNAKLLRSDKRFSSSSADYYEILIYPQPGKPQLVNKNQVKLTWRSAENGLKTFNLKNVSVQYKPYGILITGDFEIGKKTMTGVSIGIIPQQCIH